MTATIHDIVVDTFDDEVLLATLADLGGGELLPDPLRPDEPYLTEDGYLVVRAWGVDIVAYAREIQRRVRALRVVSVHDRTPGKEQDGD